MRGIVAAGAALVIARLAVEAGLEDGVVERQGATVEIGAGERAELDVGSRGSRGRVEMDRIPRRQRRLLRRRRRVTREAEIEDMAESRRFASRVHAPLLFQ